MTNLTKHPDWPAFRQRALERTQALSAIEKRIAKAKTEAERAALDTAYRAILRIAADDREATFRGEGWR